MSNSQIERIKRFLGDKEMEETIKQVLYSSFLKERMTSDVYILAAQTLSVQMLEQAWRHLQSYRTETKQSSQNNQVGL